MAKLKINRPEESVELDVSSFLAPKPSGQRKSCIDEYYSYSRKLVLATSDRAVYEKDEIIKYFLLSVVSNVEYYLRSVLSRLIYLCPDCRSSAASQMLALGSVDYYSFEDIGFALVEHKSLSSKKEIIKETFNFTGFQIKANSSVEGALENFNKVCQLRHAIVHSRGEVNGKNVRDLGVLVDGLSEIKVDIWKLQAALSSANNFVRAYNAFLFGEVVWRWGKSDRSSGDWQRDKSFFFFFV